MKTHLPFHQMRTIFYTLLFCIFLLTSCENQKKNEAIIGDDAIAYAYPLDDIVLDGDLSDWPEDLGRYPIKNAELGDMPKGTDDFQGNFRIGYSMERNEVYVAMEIVDESVVVDTTGNSFWDNQDGLELYVNQESLQSGSPVTQYSEYGGDRSAYGAKKNWDNVEMKKQWTQRAKP